MPRTRLSIAVYLALVFLSGVLVGVLGHRFYTAQAVSAEIRRSRSSPEEYRRRYIEEMRSRLHLSQEQVEKIEAVLDSTRDEYRSAIRALQDAQARKIRELLSPQQAAEYEKMRREREERRRKSQKTPGY